MSSHIKEEKVIQTIFRQPCLHLGEKQKSEGPPRVERREAYQRVHLLGKLGLITLLLLAMKAVISSSGKSIKE